LSRFDTCLQNMPVNAKNYDPKALTGCFARDGRRLIRLSTSPMLAKTPNRKAAVAYLATCGAIAITIIVRDGLGVIIVGKTASGTVAAQWWVRRRVKEFTMTIING